MDILSLEMNEIKEFMVSIGEAGFRGEQVFEWLHKKHATGFDEMTNISFKLREKLKNTACIQGVLPAEKYSSAIDDTVKFLFKIKGGSVIESVLMKYDYGRSVCVSTQAGCRQGCSFCASAIGGLERNLTAGEILSQIYEIERSEGIKVSRVVMMGCGEPLDNFENSVRFINILSNAKGEGMSRRRITLSTCGLTDRIYDLAKLKLPITLAISLHAPNDDIRKKIMPVAHKYKCEDVIKAALYYGNATGRRVTFEYALIKGVNDSAENAAELGNRLKGKAVHINLIPVNDVKERSYIKSSEGSIKAFCGILNEMGIENTVRRRLGGDINAACGQLRKSYAKKNEVTE